MNEREEQVRQMTAIQEQLEQEKHIFPPFGGSSTGALN